MKPQPLAVAAALAALGFIAAPASAQGRGQAHWSGTVDDTAVIYIHGADVRTTTTSGKSTSNVNVRDNGPLPRRPVTIFLEQQRGRGRVRIIQQPSPGNDYTAAVRVRDPQSGAGQYEFTLGWQPRGGYRRF